MSSILFRSSFCRLFFFFNDTATTEIYTLSLHDALPIKQPLPPQRAPYRARPRAEQSEALDRKSTRLNSSHVENSYAVFCLKKKRDSQYCCSVGRIARDGAVDTAAITNIARQKNRSVGGGIACITGNRVASRGSDSTKARSLLQRLRRRRFETGRRSVQRAIGTIRARDFRSSRSRRFSQNAERLGRRGLHATRGAGLGCRSKGPSQWRGPLRVYSGSQDVDPSWIWLGRRPARHHRLRHSRKPHPAIFPKRRLRGRPRHWD